eukprot:CAMPEP_0185021994 /NCGR_PEP_ID=MMETSP1103-20130426/4696_1 /TAXON_ID=36769 /ORGANISM="Paraphysomonas bandaiensis, Strain Caron Lab Isolate" /LENGTH=1963 /DNA_ID=CAMNT_0027553841 /DNA_START=9 /DNA_END=5900 /DNA_ORIENTATION=+
MEIQDENVLVTGNKKHHTPRGKSPMKSPKTPGSGRTQILSIIDNLSRAETQLRRSSSKKSANKSNLKNSSSKENNYAEEDSHGLGSLLGAAETSPIIQIGDMPYRPSTGKSTTKKRRETFVGGTDAMESMLCDTSDADLNISTQRVDRRMTADPSDIEAMMRELETEEDTNNSTVSNISELNTSHIATGEMSANISVDSNLNSSQSQNMSRRSSKGEKSSGKSKRRETFTGGSAAIEGLLQDTSELDDSTNTSQMFDEGKMSSSRPSRRMTADPSDIEAMMRELEEEEADTSTSSSVGNIPQSEEVSTMDGYESPAEKSDIRPSPRRSPRFSRANTSESDDTDTSVSKVAAVKRRSTSRKNKRRSSVQSSAADSVVSTGDDFHLVNDSFDLDTNKSHATAEPDDIQSMMRHMDDDSINDSCNDTNESVMISPLRESSVSVVAPSPRRSPRFARTVTNSDMNANISVASNSRNSQSKSRRSSKGEKSVGKSNRRETFTGGSAAIEGLLQDTSELDNSTAGEKSLDGLQGRRMTADSSDIEAMMRELEAEHATSRYSESGRREESFQSPDDSNDIRGPGSRESVDTIVLMRSVDALLGEHGSNKECTDSPVSSVQDSLRGDALVDTDDSCIESPYTKNHTDDSDIVRDDETVNTVELLADVQDIVRRTGIESDVSTDEKESDSFNMETSALSDEDNTISTMGSLRSFLESPNTKNLPPPGSTPATKKLRRASSGSDTLQSIPSYPSYNSPEGENALAAVPTEGNSMPAPIGLRSCLSSRKKPRASVSVASVSKRNVMFGSPQAVEFNKTSPTTSFTPMRQNDVKTRFSMAGSLPAADEVHDEATDENSRILEEWDRLTNASEGSDEEVEESSKRRSSISLSTPPRTKKSRRKSVSSTPVSSRKNKRLQRRRKSMTHSETYNPDDDLPSFNSADDSALDVSVMSTCSSNHNLDDSTISHTQNLPGNLHELLDEKDIVGAYAKVESPANSVTSDLSTGSPAHALHTLVHSSVLNESMRQAELSMEESREEYTATMTLESNLSSLMRNIAAPDLTNASVDSSLSLSRVNAAVPDSHSVASSGGSKGLDVLIGNTDSTSDIQDDGKSPAANRMSQIATSISSSPSDSSIVSSVASDESVVSFKKPVNTPITSTNKSQEISTSDMPEFTEELETNLGALMSRVGSDRDVHTPEEIHTSKQSIDVDCSDMPECTEELETNLGALVQRVETSSEPHMETEVSDIDTSKANLTPENEQGNISTTSDIFIGEDQRQYIMDTSVANSSFSTLPEGDVENEDDNLMEYSSLSISLRKSVCAPPAPRGTPGVLRRLRSLNAVSRQQTLAQCQTPLALTGRMSIGMKRHSLASRQADSTSKRITQRHGDEVLSSLRLSRSAKKLKKPDEEIEEEDIDDETPISSPMVISTQLMSRPPVEDFHYFLSRIGVDISEHTSPSMDEIDSDSFYSVIKEFCKSYQEKLSISPEEGGLCELSAEAEEEFISGVAGTLYDVLSAAVEETDENPSLPKSEDLYEKWSTCMTNDMYESVRHAAFAVTTNSKPDMAALKSQVDVCMRNTSLRWRTWEKDLMMVAAETIGARKLSQREENAELKEMFEEQDRVAKSEAERQLNEAQTVEEQINAMKKRLDDAKKQYEQKRMQVQELRDSVSILVQQKKDRLIELANQSSNEQHSDVESAVNTIDEEVEKAEIDIEDIQSRIGVINNITWCRILSYKTSEISVRVFVTKDVTVDMTFYMGMVDGHLSVTHFESTPSFAAHVAPTRNSMGEESFALLQSEETKLAAAYYVDFLSSSYRDGPLSDASLQLVNKPADIPKLLQQVSGYVGSFRTVLSWLNRRNLSPLQPSLADKMLASECEWTWHIEKSSQTSFNEGYAVVMQHTSGACVRIPLHTLVSGDMKLLPIQSIKLKSSYVDSDSCVEETDTALLKVQQSLDGIAARCSSPFGSFPLGQLMRAVVAK